jgi:ribosomal protein S6--L-glutamate ligase
VPPLGFLHFIESDALRPGYITLSLVSLVRRVALELDIDYAGFDVALVDGYPYLLEFNRRFGNDALRQQGIRLGSRILAYLQFTQRDNDKSVAIAGWHG